MIGTQPFLLVCFFTAGILPRLALAAGGSYDLNTVRGMVAFKGSGAAREILGRNGFVVADPSFKQIFEAYIESPEIEGPSEKNPEGASLPAFITTDSAWHTYHVLLEEGVKELEESQSQSLRNFSRRLWTAAKDRAQKNGAANELELFASVGLALQDESHRQSLSAEARRIVEALRAGSALVPVPIGFELSPLQFRAQSFYTQSPELSAYFAARQWYAGVVFRLADARETRLAVALSALVMGDPELSALWKQLSDPLDRFLAPAEDGTVREYVETARTVLGREINPASPPDPQQLREIQKKLEGRLGFPRVNDQILSPEQYAKFPEQTRGFRLLPPRRLPCAVCFQNTIDPKIRGRRYPSGLDFLAASASLRSPAAIRAVQSQFGKEAGDLILKTDCGPMPDSLHGEAMQLLSTLQKPLPAHAPASMRNEAWSDLQLWAQLGAWAEQRHTWALHTKLTVSVMGIITPPQGMVAPYPEFFSGLATLTRRTAETFQKAAPERPFEAKAVAADLLELLLLSRGELRRDQKEMEKLSGRLEQFNRFQNLYYEKHRAELEKNGSSRAYQKFEHELVAMARRCGASGDANEAERETLRSFFESRQNIISLLNGFAPCAIAWRSWRGNLSPAKR